MENAKADAIAQEIGLGFAVEFVADLPGVAANRSAPEIVDGGGAAIGGEMDIEPFIASLHGQIGDARLDGAPVFVADGAVDLAEDFVMAEADAADGAVFAIEKKFEGSGGQPFERGREAAWAVQGPFDF